MGDPPKWSTDKPRPSPVSTTLTFHVTISVFHNLIDPPSLNKFLTHREIRQRLHAPLANSTHFPFHCFVSFVAIRSSHRILVRVLIIQELVNVHFLSGFSMSSGILNHPVVTLYIRIMSWYVHLDLRAWRQ